MKLSFIAHLRPGGSNKRQGPTLARADASNSPRCYQHVGLRGIGGCTVRIQQFRFVYRNDSGSAYLAKLRLI
jgi:hypothetical protein